MKSTTTDTDTGSQRRLTLARLLAPAITLALWGLGYLIVKAV